MVTENQKWNKIFIPPQAGGYLSDIGNNKRGLEFEPLEIFYFGVRNFYYSSFTITWLGCELAKIINFLIQGNSLNNVLWCYY